MGLPTAIRDKLLHSEFHYKLFEAKLKGYCQTHPSTIVCESNEATNERFISVVPTEPIPTHLSLIIGDVLQNLRSALDYLVWELVIAAKNEPTQYNAFLICSTAKSFREAKGKRLKGVDAEAIALIESLQPYHFGEQRKSNASLLVLDELANINKHRRILLTRLAPVVLDGLASRDDKPKIIIPFGMNESDVNTQYAASIQFNDGPAQGLEIINCVNTISRCIHTNVLPLFERFFD
jgi:hypothetical protein